MGGGSGVAVVASHPPTQSQFIDCVGIFLQALFGSQMPSSVPIAARNVSVVGSMGLTIEQSLGTCHTSHPLNADYSTSSSGEN
jgi:hypothetical protein